MKIHSDTLTVTDLSAAIGTAGISGMWIEDVTQVGSRKRGHAFDVFPAAEKVKGRRPRGTAKGRRGLYAPTYREYGLWMVALFAIDPDAIVGSYEGIGDFHAQTRGEFRTVSA